MRTMRSLPGHYIFSVALDAGTGEEKRVGVVGVGVLILGEGDTLAMNFTM